nr:uncharacterized protein LOC111989255 [Quercus suber]
MDFEKIILVVSLVTLCLFLASSYRVSGTRILSDLEDLAMERQLKSINKLPVKSIQTEFGHIVDCIDINKQPSFDHPLLKDHKIQRIPNFLREKPKTGDLSKARPSMIGLAKGACPSGTVPIRRTTKEDLLASKLLLNNIHPQATSSFNGSYSAFLQMEEKYYTGIEGNITVYDPPVKEGQTYAQSAFLQMEEKYYTGIEGNITVYDPPVKEGQTYAQVYVQNGVNEDYFNLIATGWMNDNFKQSGCINYVCPGFIQTDKSVYLGARISNISVPNGNLFQLRISLQQDLNYNWWLSFGNNVVGYYPAELLFNLNKPQGIGWGGVAVGTPNGYIPPMESGSFPDGNPLHSSFTNIKYRNQLNETLVPQSPHYQLIIDNPKCYDLKYDGYKNEELGFTFQIGGPGGSCPD